MNDTVPEGLAHLHVLVEGLSEAAVHVADHPDTRLVHQPDHLPVVFRGPETPPVEVEIERRKLRPGDVGPGKFHQGLGHGRHFGGGPEARMGGKLGSLLFRLTPGNQAAGCNEQPQNRQPANHSRNSFGKKRVGHCDRAGDHRQESIPIRLSAKSAISQNDK